MPEIRRTTLGDPKQYANRQSARQTNNPHKPQLPNNRNKDNPVDDPGRKDDILFPK